jgi:SAM-dependent methyltransferase
MQPNMMFAESAPYERFMGRWSRRLAPLLVRFAGVRDGESVLDVGSGTGALSAAIADAGPAVQVVGLDPSAAYVADANARSSTHRVRFVTGDAQALQFEPGAFDRVLSLLVLNFVPDRAKAMREMIRVTRRGGVVAAAVWDYADGMQMLRTFWDEAVAGDPSLASRDEANMPLCRAGQLAALWQEHGLGEVVEQPISIDTRFGSFDDYWTPFLGGQGPAGAYVAGLSEADRADLRMRLRQRLIGAGADHPIDMNARAWAARGIVR